MVTIDGVQAAFVILELGGCKRPAGWAREVLPQVFDMWISLLPDITNQQIAQAATSHVRDGSAFWPTAGQLLQRVKPKPTGHEWEPVWRRVLEGVRVARRDHPPSHEGPTWALDHRMFMDSGGGSISAPWRISADPEVNSAALNAIEALGGWMLLCNTKTEELSTFRRMDFQRSFTARGDAGTKQIAHDISEQIIEQRQSRLRLLTSGDGQ